ELEEDTNPAMTNVALVSNSNGHIIIDVGNCSTYKEMRRGTIPKGRLPKMLQKHHKFIPHNFYNVDPSNIDPSDEPNIAGPSASSKRPRNTDNTQTGQKKRAVHTEGQDVQDNDSGNERHAKQIVLMLEDPSLAKVFAEYLAAQARSDR
ncbi:hypothetical protein C0991_004525, partial [Blastosporella zonata]